MARTWRPTAGDPLLLFAMDHRESFGRTLFGVTGAADAAQLAAMEAAKQLMYDGLIAGAAGIARGRAGVLVDEELGSAVIARATAAGTTLAVPIEASGHDWFTLEYGDAWMSHVDAVDPDWVKVLIRDNPDLDRDHRRAQLEALAGVASRLREHGRRLLYELIVPSTPAQLASVGGDALRYDTELRPALVVDVIRDNYAAGIVPDLWKIEGLETVAACRDVAAAARADGHDADLIVLGRDAPAERLDHWLEIARQVDGFVGFAIGRSIWEDAVREFETGDGGPEARARAVDAIAARYAHFIDRWSGAR
jgi:myo-inositol catabolism protein IolC